MVYGGGGIMPDIYVPIDTTWTTEYYLDILRNSLHNQFSLTYVNDHREELNKQYPDAFAFLNGFKVTEGLWKEFIDYATSEEVAFNEEEFETCKERLDLLLRSTIARNLYDFEAFWVVYNSQDEAIDKAMEAMHDETFRKMKIASK